MPTITSISKRIISLEQLTQKLHLVQANNDQFFPEWTENLPELSDSEKQILDKYYQRYRRHRDRAELPEETVKLLLVFPLLELVGFYDEPSILLIDCPFRCSHFNCQNPLLLPISSIIRRDTNLWRSQTLSRA